MNRHFYSAIQTTGIDLDKIMLLSRFGGGWAEKKDVIVSKLIGFFERYYGLI